MKKSYLYIYRRLLAIISVTLFIAAIIILFIHQEKIAGIFLVLTLVVSLVTIYVIDAYKRELIDKYYGLLSSLISSLTLESDQTPFTQRKHYRRLRELEGLILTLHSSISKKTTVLRNRNFELKKRQAEALKKNKELTLAYKALKLTRDRYEKLISNLEEEYFLYNINSYGTIEDVSASVFNILGYSKEEFAKMRSELITSNPINKEAKKCMSKAMKGKTQQKYLIELFHKDGTPRVLEISEVPVFDAEKNLIVIEGIAHNISKRYNAEELIREQEEKYRQVFNSASDFIFIYSINKDDQPGKFIEANTYTQKKLGYKQEELKKMTPDDLNAAEIWNAEENKENNQKYERIWETKEGEIINVEISEHSIKIKGERSRIAVARDITERKRAVEEITFMNEELVNQKENLEALLDNLTQTQEQLVQSEKMAALGQLIAGVAHEINTPLGAIKASVGNLSDSLESALNDLPELFKNQSKENIELFLAVFEISRVRKQDLSSREKREYKRNIQKVLLNQDIESADVIADLLVYLEVYEDYERFFDVLKKPETIKILKNSRDFISLIKNTKTISIATEKASKVVFALKKYAHRDSLGEKIPTDINDGIETVLTLYENQLKQGLTVIKNFCELPMAMCYTDEINQVWTNLIHNGIQAMGKNGVLTITTHADEKHIFVSINDSGEGIEPTIIGKIFDPFFTTKKRGEGSGLGLDIVKKIIDKHNGSIDVTSELGKGSTFLITLPIF